MLPIGSEAVWSHRPDWLGPFGAPAPTATARRGRLTPAGNAATPSTSPSLVAANNWRSPACMIRSETTPVRNGRSHVRLSYIWYSRPHPDRRSLQKPVRMGNDPTLRSLVNHQASLPPLHDCDENRKSPGPGMPDAIPGSA